MANRDCPICGTRTGIFADLVNHLSDGTIVCEKCAAKTRFLRPMDLKIDFDPELGDEVIMKNPTEKMSLEKFREILDETDDISVFFPRIIRQTRIS